MKIALIGFIVKKKKLSIQGGRLTGRPAWATVEEVRTLEQAQLYVEHESGKFKFVPQYRRV